MILIKIGVIFGGMSTENEVSIKSGTSVINNLDKNKYNIIPIYLDKLGNFYTYGELEQGITFEYNKMKRQLISNVMEYLKKLRIIFPVLHGLYGEDGTIQGLFEIIGVPYVGCGVLASSIGMDKIYSKIIFDHIGIKQTNYIFIKKSENKYVIFDRRFNEKICETSELTREISKHLKYPMFVKPSRAGSSVGINKAKNEAELIECIKFAFRFDEKVLIEEQIIGKEIECGVLGENEILTSEVGEIKSAEEFYSYNAKYKNSESKTLIPAGISYEKRMEIKELAEKVFKAIDGKGLSRIDFFIQEKTEEIYINEINTMPGFTDISMYPKLFKNAGISYKCLLDKIIEISL